MTRSSILFSAAIIAAALALPATVKAEDKVIAKVDGKEITEAQLALAEQDLGQGISGVPENQKRLVLLEFLIEHQLLANAAEKEKYNQGEDFDRRMAYYTRRALRDAYFEKSIRDSVSEKAAKKIYDDQSKGLKPETEIRARHILLKKEDEAKAVVKELASGAKFEEVAKKKSTGPSAANGGDLGYFTKGRMVKPFEDAVFALKKGEVSAPVKTKFGWHVIKVEDVRTRPIPTFDDVKDRIMSSLIQTTAQDTVAKLHKNGKIEVFDEELAKQREQLRKEFEQRQKATMPNLPLPKN